MKLDYEIKDEKGRVEHVKEVLKSMDHPTDNDLSYMADYILRTQERTQTATERTKQYPCITSNRNSTIIKRESSMDGLLEKLGDDFYNITSDNPGNQLLDPKDKDPFVDNAVETYMKVISTLSEQFKKAEGQRRYALKKQIIETYQQITIVRSGGRPSSQRNPAQIKSVAKLDLSGETITFDNNSMPQSDATITLFNPHHIAYLLSFYSPLKQECWEDLEGDMRWLLIDLENTVTRALPAYLEDLVTVKIDGMGAEEVAQHMLEQWGLNHTAQYWSTVWRQKVPKMVAEQARKDYISFYWRNHGGQWRECPKCGHTYPLHPLFYTTNGKNRFYTVCRKCRSKKKVK